MVEAHANMESQNLINGGWGVLISSRGLEKTQKFNKRGGGGMFIWHSRVYDKNFLFEEFLGNKLFYLLILKKRYGILLGDKLLRKIFFSTKPFKSNIRESLPRKGSI